MDPSPKPAVRGCDDAFPPGCGDSRLDPATAEYPHPYADKPSRNWWKFGFPVSYVTDLLQILEALVPLGYAYDARLASTFDLVRSKQDAEGRWPLEYSYAGKTWLDFGPRKMPNKWVTLRALRVLKAAGSSAPDRESPASHRLR